MSRFYPFSKITSLNKSEIYFGGEIEQGEIEYKVSHRKNKVNYQKLNSKSGMTELSWTG